MTYRPHLHLLSHLVLERQRASSFSFSEKFSSQAFSRVERQTRREFVASLESQLRDARALLGRLRGEFDDGRVGALQEKILFLEKKIERKKEKLDLTGPLP